MYYNVFTYIPIINITYNTTYNLTLYIYKYYFSYHILYVYYIILACNIIL